MPALNAKGQADKPSKESKAPKEQTKKEKQPPAGEFLLSKSPQSRDLATGPLVMSSRFDSSGFFWKTTSRLQNTTKTTFRIEVFCFLTLFEQLFNLLTNPSHPNLFLFPCISLSVCQLPSHTRCYSLSLSLSLFFFLFSFFFSLSLSQYVSGSRALKFGRRFGQGQHVQEQGPRSRNKSRGRWWESSLAENIRHKGRVYSSATIFWQAFFLMTFYHLSRQTNSDERPLLMSSSDLSTISLSTLYLTRLFSDSRNLRTCLYGF